MRRRTGLDLHDADPDRHELSHLVVLSRFLSMSTLNPAVVRIFIWYVTWNVATSKFDAATNCKLFWMTYKMAGMDNFQQSELKTALPSFRNRPISRLKGAGEAAATARLDLASKVYSALDA
ncbi:hypothetical protein FRB90_008525, partial [Tulasnella sp. 427]